MIVLPRREAGRFRAAARRCVVGRPRGLAPPVLIHQTRETLTLSANLGEVTLSLQLSAVAEVEERLIVPFGLLEAIDGNGSELVSIEEVKPGTFVCRWMERGEARETTVEAVSAEPELVAMPSPGRMRSVDA